jgi:hypothetical protein
LPVLIGVSAALLFLAMSSGGFDAEKSDPQGGYYQRLTTSFLEGQLALMDEAPSGLLALANPFDPNLNAPYRSYGVHDSVLFDGKLFYYWGPGVVVFVTLPARLVGITLSETDIGRYAGVLFCILVGLIVRETALRRTLSRWLVSVLTCGLALSPSLFLLVSRLAIWEANTIVALDCSLAAVLFLLKAQVAPINSRTRWIMAGAIVIGVGTTIRTECLLLLPLVLFDQLGRKSGRQPLHQVALRLAPAAIAVGALGLYNALRFGNPLDFGVRRILAGADQSGIAISSISYVLPNLKTYLFSPIDFTRTFPYVDLRPVKLAVPNLPASEIVGGLITTSPWVIIVALGGGYTIIRRWHQAKSEPLAPMITAVGVTQLVFVSYAIFGASGRYLVSPMILIAIGSINTVADAWIIRQRSIHILIGCLIVPSLAMSPLLAAHGYYPDQVPKNAVFQSLRGFLDPIISGDQYSEISVVHSEYNGCRRVEYGNKNARSAELASFGSQVVRFQIDLPTRGWTGFAPLLSYGRTGAADVVGIAWDGKTVKLLHDHWRIAPVVGPPIKIGANRGISVVLAIKPRLAGLVGFVNGVASLDSKLRLFSDDSMVIARNAVGASTVTAQAPYRYTVSTTMGNSKCNDVASFQALLVGGCLIEKSEVEGSSNISTRDISAIAAAIVVDLETIRGEGGRPLFSSGKPGRGDVIGIEVIQSRLTVFHDHWGNAPQYSSAVSIARRTKPVQFTLIRDSNKTLVFLNEQLILESSYSLYDRQTIVAGSNLINATTTSRDLGASFEQKQIARCQN